MEPRFVPTERSKLRRRPQRGAYDEETVFRILDSAVVCHIGYVIDGQPYVTPTAFWREGRRLYWHGSAAGRALEAQTGGVPVCLTVSHVDGLLVGRSGFSSSICYRSVMAFGTATKVSVRAAKRRAMNAFVERLYPGRTAEVRPIRDDELQQISVLTMTIDEASAKVRTGPVSEKGEDDYAATCWAGIIPLRQAVGAPEPDGRLAPGTTLSKSLEGYAAGDSLDTVLLQAIRRAET